LLDARKLTLVIAALDGKFNWSMQYAGAGRCYRNFLAGIVALDEYLGLFFEKCIEP